MKNKKLHIKRNSLILLIGCLLVVPLLSSNFTLASVSESTDIPDFTLTALTPHTAISILNDTAFTLYGFPGDGSSDNPYRIENLNITTSYIHGILVTGTTANFTIQDCYIDALAFGINIESIAMNTAEIKRNYCVNNTENGITLYNALAVNITDNFCVNNGQGIYTDYADFSIFKNNTCNENGVGIYLYDTYDCYIIQNKLIENVCGIWGDYIYGNEYIENIIKDGSVGFYGNNGQILAYRNHIENMTDYGMQLYKLESSHVVLNSIKDTGSYGMSLNSSTLLIVSNNSITYSTLGIVITNSNGSTYTFNRMQLNTGYGVKISNSCTLNVFHHNAFIDNAAGVGNSQAYDESLDSTWYEYSTNQGNFWSDYVGTGNYSIDGGLYEDPYPLVASPVIPELNSKMSLWFTLLFVFFIPIIQIARKRKK